MRDFSIDLIWAKIQIAITAIGGWLGYFLGGLDGLMIALIVLMTLDYVSGVMCAITWIKSESRIAENCLSTTLRTRTRPLSINRPSMLHRKYWLGLPPLIRQEGKLSTTLSRA